METNKKIEKHLVTIELRPRDILSSDYLREVIQNVLEEANYRCFTVHCEPVDSQNTPTR